MNAKSPPFFYLNFQEIGGIRFALRIIEKRDACNIIGNFQIREELDIFLIRRNIVDRLRSRSILRYSFVIRPGSRSFTSLRGKRKLTRCRLSRATKESLKGRFFINLNLSPVVEQSSLRGKEKMAFNNNFDRAFPRKMYQGNWKCSECGKEITELPFEPSGDRPLYCRDCHAKRRPQRFGRY